MNHIIVTHIYIQGIIFVIDIIEYFHITIQGCIYFFCKFEDMVIITDGNKEIDFFIFVLLSFVSL